MKRIKPFIYLTFIGTLLFSCHRHRADPVNRAEELCDCVRNIDEFRQLPSDRRTNFLKNRNTVSKDDLSPCVLDVWKAIDLDLKYLNQDGKVAYSKKFLKATIDTECTDRLLRFIPFDQLSVGIDYIENKMMEDEAWREEYMDELEREPRENY